MQTVTTVSEFSSTDPAPTLRWGKLFGAGTYPDKSYSMTADELKAAVDAFEPVFVDLEHTPTVLSEKLGRVEQVTLSEDGTTLMGGVREPSWLSDLLGDTPRKVSCTWDREKKHLMGLAYVLDPHIPDAAVFSAYATFAGKRHNATDQADLQAIHDHTVKLGAACAPAKMSQEKTPMTLWDQFKAAFDKMDEQPAAFTIGTTQVAAPSNPPTAELERLRAENARKDAELVAFKRQQVDTDAATFADAEIADRRAYPAERDALVAAFTVAALDDAAHGQVTFANGTTSSRVAVLKAQQAARPPHQLTKELVGVVALSNNGPAAQADELARVRAAAKAYAEQNQPATKGA